jgi:hypothetical protein
VVLGGRNSENPLSTHSGESSTGEGLLVVPDLSEGGALGVGFSIGA